MLGPLLPLFPSPPTDDFLELASKLTVAAQILVYLKLRPSFTLNKISSCVIFMVVLSL